MAQRKDDTPSVATYADHEVITPPHELRKRHRGRPPEATTIRSRAPKRRWSQLSSNSPTGCMPNASGSKRRARTSSGAASPKRPTMRCFAPPTTSRARPRHSAIPQSAGVAESLCRLLEHTPEIGAHPARAGRSARRCRARHHPRTCPPRSRRRRRRADAAAARRHRRVPQARERLSTGISRKHFFAAARSRATAGT